ncbi:hypothetical protein BGZ46_005280, partial [Entomortierella lignicola]
MEIEDEPKLVLLDNLNSTALSSSINRTMRTVTTGFESALHPQLIDSTGAPLDPALLQEHRLKNRLQNFVLRVPTNVAQTHSRTVPIKLGVGRVDRRRLNSYPVAAVTTTTVSLKSTSSLILSPTQIEPNSISYSLSFTSGPGSTPCLLNSDIISSSRLFDKNKNNNDDDNVNDHSVSMAPREGFTLSNSLIEKVKARVWHNATQQKLHPVTKSHFAEDISASQKDSVDSKGLNGDSTEMESNASNSSPNTLSAGTGGNINSSGHLDVLDHLNPTNTHDSSNDSDGTVTDLEESTTTRLRQHQRKYSFSSLKSHDVNTTLTVADSSQAQVNTELTTLGAPSQPSADNGTDPLGLFEEILGRQHLTEDAIAASLHELRQLILAYGIPEQ